MGEFVLVLTMLLFEFFGPVIVAGLVVWGLVVLFRGVRLKKSLNAAKEDAEAQRLEGLRIKSGVVRFFSLAGGFAGLVFGAMATGQLEGGFFGAILGYGPLSLWARSMKREYEATFKEVVVAPELAKTFDNLVYEPHGVFDAETLRDLGFFTRFSGVAGSDRITAEYKGIRFVQSDISLLEQGRGGADRETAQQVSLFNGRVMRFAFAESFSGPVQVVRRDFAQAQVTGERGAWQPVETELAELGEDYRIFALNPLDAMRVLTPQMIEGIFYLDKAVRVPLAFYFTGNFMYAFLALTRDAFDVSRKKTLLEEREFLQKDITLVTDFLETMYFRAQADEARPDSADHASGSAAPAVSPLAVPLGLTGGAALESASSEEAALVAPVPPVVTPSPAAPYRARQERPVDLAAPTLNDTIRRAGYTLGSLGKVLSRLALFAPLGFYLASAVYMLVEFPDGFALSFSSNGDTVSIGGRESTLGYLVIGSIFIIPSALALGAAAADIVANIFGGGGSGKRLGIRFKSICGNVFGAAMMALPFLLHLLYLSVNVAYR